MATAAAAIVTLTEYLGTSYHPDCEWIEGELRERSVPELSHSSVQMFFLMFFGSRKREFGIRVYPELRMQVAAERFRIPDIMVVKDDDPVDEIVRRAPLLCVEVLSPDDRMSDTQEKVDEYLDMGVDAVWVVDPRRRKAFQTDVRSLQPVEILTVPGTKIAIPLADVFEELDELKKRRR